LRIVDQPALPRLLYTSRYERLLDNLIEGDSDTVASAMLLTECEQVVLALDRVWWAIRKTPAWISYQLGSLDPVRRQSPSP